MSSSAGSMTIAEAPVHLSPDVAAELFERNPIPMWIVDDADGHVRDVNEAARHLCDLTIAPDSILEVIVPDEREAFLAWLADDGAVARGGEWHHVTPGGASVTVEARGMPLRSGDGSSVLVVIRDLRPRMRLEEGLRRSQKLEAIGRLAGSIAHDFNNLLTAIGGHADLLRLTLAPDSDGRDEADDIKRSVERGARLTRQLLAFARRQPLSQETADLNGAIEGLRPMLERLLGPAVRLELGLAPDSGHVRLDAGQLDQVAMNLAINARDAMPEGGRLLIETAAVELDAAFGRKEPGLAPGRYGLLAVSDEGVGLTEEARAHLFEPFFTTKPAGSGTGLGLATVYGIVRQSGGHVAVWSEPGMGTTFRVYLPSAIGPHATDLEPSGDVAALRQTAPARIAVVDDEPSILAFVAATLRRNGHRVDVATDGRLGLERLADRIAEYDLVISDVLMPGLTGPAMIDHLRDRRPELPVLFVSGNTRDERLLPHLEHPHTGMLGKPFTADELLGAIDVLLPPEAGRRA
jgi:two-component system, cell cycle sensor histidine kinase and response regulator CckA